MVRVRLQYHLLPHLRLVPLAVFRQLTVFQNRKMSVSLAQIHLPTNLPSSVLSIQHLQLISLALKKIALFWLSQQFQNRHHLPY